MMTAQTTTSTTTVDDCDDDDDENGVYKHLGKGLIMSTTNRTVPYIFNEIEGKLSTLFIKTKSILNNEAPNRINGANCEHYIECVCIYG